MTYLTSSAFATKYPRSQKKLVVHLELLLAVLRFISKSITVHGSLQNQTERKGNYLSLGKRMLHLPVYHADWGNGYALRSFPGGTKFEFRLS